MGNYFTKHECEIALCTNKAKKMCHTCSVLICDTCTHRKDGVSYCGTCIKRSTDGASTDYLTFDRQ
jgi:hypothetical protein